MEEVRLRAEEEQKNVDSTAEQTAVTRATGKAEATRKNVKDKSSNSSFAEQDLDTFLLGDLEDKDDAPKPTVDGGGCSLALIRTHFISGAIHFPASCILFISKFLLFAAFAFEEAHV
ncbi:hypothetical protein RIF29_28970 [Crotalaria pallida]|uniref:Uncharacterized protein n=1 Tax=Crotalaria pallida TaxID=3830 RepID=A0AAN9EDN3_CROPI